MSNTTRVPTSVYALPWERFATREQWEASRVSFIGASEGADVYGLGRFGSPMSVYQSKIAPQKGRVTLRMRKGLHMESLIEELLRERTGLTIIDPGRFTIIRMEARPYIAATPDRMIDATAGVTVRYRGELRELRGIGIAEFKDTTQYKADDWADGPPQAVLIQAQHQMLCTGAQWGIVAVVLNLDRDEDDAFEWFIVERDDAFLYEHMLALELFWANHVMRRVPPPSDGHAATTRALQRLYGQEANGATRIATPTEGVILSAADAERMRRRAEVRTHELELERLDNLFRASIGDAAGILLPTGVQYLWTSTRRGDTVSRRLVRKAGK